MTPEPPSPAPKHRSVDLGFLFGPTKHASVPGLGRHYRAAGLIDKLSLKENPLTFLCFLQRLEHETQRKSLRSDLRAHFCLRKAALFRAAAPRVKCGDLAVIQVRVSSSGEADVAEMEIANRRRNSDGSSLILPASFSCRSLEPPPLKRPRSAPRVGGVRPTTPAPEPLLSFVQFAFKPSACAVTNSTESPDAPPAPRRFQPRSKRSSFRAAAAEESLV